MDDLNPNTQRIVALSPYPIWQVSADGVLIYANAAALPFMSMLSCEIGQLLPKSWLEWAQVSQNTVGVQEPNLWMFEGKVYSLHFRWDSAYSVVNIYMIDVTEQNKLAERVDYLKEHDILTELPNLTVFKRTMAQAIAQDLNSNSMTAVLVIDIEHFKELNCRLGYYIGDILLKLVAERLRDFVSTYEKVSRLSGNEFVVVYPNVQDSAELEQKVEELHEHLMIPFSAKGHRLTITTSIGVAISPIDDVHPDKLLKKAQLALHHVQVGSLHQHHFYQDELNKAFEERYRLQNELRHAVDLKQLIVEYEPRVCLKTQRILGAEALVRWQHPELGLIAPGHFIPLAEEHGFITHIGEWVIENVCEQLSKWVDKGFKDLSISVNFSALQFREARLMHFFSKLTAEYGFLMSQLEIEITESILLHDYKNIIEMLYKLKAYGLKISLDDFGTGYSSLGYLAQIPADKLKIDKSFIQNMTYSAENQVIIDMIIELAHRLHMRVCAEGIETPEQLAYIEAHDCDEGQGYYFARSMSALAFETLLMQEQAGPWFKNEAR